MNCGQQQRLLQHCNSVWQVVRELQRQGQGQKDSSGDWQNNNASTIQAATLRHWIHMDIASHMVITSVGTTMEHRVTIPCQEIRVQPTEQRLLQHCNSVWQVVRELQRQGTCD